MRAGCLVKRKEASTTARFPAEETAGQEAGELSPGWVGAHKGRLALHAHGGSQNLWGQALQEAQRGFTSSARHTSTRTALLRWTVAGGPGSGDPHCPASASPEFTIWRHPVAGGTSNGASSPGSSKRPAAFSSTTPLQGTTGDSGGCD